MCRPSESHTQPSMSPGFHQNETMIAVFIDWSQARNWLIVETVRDGKMDGGEDHVCVLVGKVRDQLVVERLVGGMTVILADKGS